MGWFRSSQKSIVGLAFFALACQLILSFGHVHLGNFGITASAVAQVAGTSDAIPTPAPQKDPTGLSRDVCAICANIGLTAALVVPASPYILVPSLFIRVLPWSAAAAERGTFNHLPFGARGPPSV
jgi:hypothetical protein